MKRKCGWKFAAVFIIVYLSAYFVPVRVLAAEGGRTADVMEMTGQGEVVSDVFVREGPSTEYEIIGTVRGGDIVPVTGKTKDYWYRIEFEDQTGFVYGDYIEFTEEETGQSQPAEDSKEPEAQEEEPDEPPTEAEEPGQEQRPEEKNSRVDWEYLRLAAVVVIVAVILAMIILILRSLLQASRQDREEEEKRNVSPKRERKSRAIKREGKKEQREALLTQDKETEEGVQSRETVPEEAKTIVIREEDYQLHIDPKYFEDEPLAQPDYVTDYLKKKELEDTKAVVKKEHTDDLTKAMKKLEELQEEIERLKNK